ncbi:MAG TPA: trigger factor [Acidimicrobiales bacterium]|nr:trigger factor [Acidimicrobiales bacterium]
MKAVAEPLEGNKVKLSVEVDEAEFEKAVDAAFRRLAREVKIDGFRPGKAPRRVLEAKLGAGVAREEAIRVELEKYYVTALRETDTDAIASPDIDITSGEETGPLVFDAVVEVRPVITVPGYNALKVVVPRPEPSEDDITAQIDRLRNQGAELNDVDRDCRNGDAVVIDIHGSQNDEIVPGLEATDLTYEVGTGTLVEGLDEAITGAKAGDVVTFTHEVPGHEGEVAFKVLVKSVKEKVLPAVTDEWASEVSEFDTVEELRADLVKRMTTVRKANAQMTLRSGVAEALADLVVDVMPDALIDGEVSRRVEDLAHRLSHQGATLQQWLEATGQSPEDFLASHREDAVGNVKVDLALRAVVAAEGIEISDDELDEELAKVAESAGEKPAKLRKQLEANGVLPAVKLDLAKAKALQWLIDNAEVVDEEGQPIDVAALTAAPETDGEENE